MIDGLHATTRLPRTWPALVGLSVAFFLGQAAFSQETNFNPPFPRIASRPHGTFLKSETTEADARHVAKHHIAILATHRTWKGGGFDMATLPAHIKSYNPKIKLIKYTNANQEDYSTATEKWIRDKLYRESGSGGKGDWWKRTPTGDHITGFEDGKGQINTTLQTTPDAKGLRWHEWFVRYWDAAPTDSGDWVAPAGYSKGRGLKEGLWDGTFSDSQFISQGKFAPAYADYNND